MSKLQWLGPGRSRRQNSTLQIEHCRARLAHTDNNQHLSRWFSVSSIPCAKLGWGSHTILEKALDLWLFFDGSQYILFNIVDFFLATGRALAALVYVHILGPR